MESRPLPERYFFCFAGPIFRFAVRGTTAVSARSRHRHPPILQVAKLKIEWQGRKQVALIREFRGILADDPNCLNRTTV
jgi:hypothetical protein